MENLIFQNKKTLQKRLNHIKFSEDKTRLFLSSDFKKIEVKEVVGEDSTITFELLSVDDAVAKESTDYLYESKNSNYSIFHGKIFSAKHSDMLLKANSEGKKKLISH